MFTANGGQRFEVLDVVQSALPSMPFGDIYPSVDALIEQYLDELTIGIKTNSAFAPRTATKY